MVLTVIVVGIFKTTTILGNAYGAPRAPRRVRVSAAGLAACEHTVSAGPLGRARYRVPDLSGVPCE